MNEMYKKIPANAEFTIQPRDTLTGGAWLELMAHWGGKSVEIYAGLPSPQADDADEIARAKLERLGLVPGAIDSIMDAFRACRHRSR